METVEISTDVLPEAMLEKLGLPCPKYDKKHAGGGCFEDSDLSFCLHLFLDITNFC
jgi:hypothetical protein